MQRIQEELQKIREIEEERKRVRKKIRTQKPGTSSGYLDSALDNFPILVCLRLAKLVDIFWIQRQKPRSEFQKSFYLWQPKIDQL